MLLTNVADWVVLLYTLSMEATEKRYWDLPSVLLLVAALWVAALRLWLTDWTAQLERVEVLTIFGLALGFALGKSRFSASTAGWLAFFYTLVVFPWQMAYVDDSPLYVQRFLLVSGRLSATLTTFLRNQPVQDSILFIATMSLLFWLISLMAAYQLVRYNRPWIPLGVAGLGVLLIEYYHPFLLRGSFLTAAFMFFSLMLLGRLQYLANRRDWEANKVTIDSEAGFDLSRGTIATALLLVVLAWNLPTIARLLTPGSEEQRHFEVSWQNVRDRMGNMVAGLQSPAVSAVADFGDHMALGTGATLGNETLLIVIPEEEVDTSQRFYWRGRSYDFYADGNWSNSFAEMRDITADDQKSWQYPDWGPVEKVAMSFRYVNGPGRTIYSPGLPITIDRDIKVQVQPINEKEADYVAILARTSLQGGEAYEVNAYVPTPSEAVLRDAPAAYPDWVTDTYLQIPQDFSPAVRQLALDITEGLETPYDKAQAITEYLRNNITYETDIETPPVDRDLLEWFLFEYKKGYCNYYATAEVMMLRSLGIPARITNGFAQGQYIPDGDYYQVKRNDSHAWPEVFFSTVGWVPFEPTVSQPTIVLPSGEEQAGLEDNNPLLPPIRTRLQEDSELPERPDRFTPDPEEYDGSFGAASRPFPVGLAILGGIALLSLAFFALRMRLKALGRWVPLVQLMAARMRKRGVTVPQWLDQWARYTELTPIQRIFAGVRVLIRFLGGSNRMDRTPSEQITALVELMPDGAQPAAVVLEEYQRSIYSPYPVDEEQARQASRQLWKQAARTWLRRRLRIEIQTT